MKWHHWLVWGLLASLAIGLGVVVLCDIKVARFSRGDTLFIAGCSPVTARATWVAHFSRGDTLFIAVQYPTWDSEQRKIKVVVVTPTGEHREGWLHKVSD